MRRLLKRLFALFWIAFVFLLVAGAITLTSVRVMLANAEGYREEVVSWLSGQLQQPVTVTGLDARLQGLQPTLLLENVRLLDPQGKRTPLQFRELRVGIDLWNSLLRQQVTLGLLTAVGAELSVRRDPQGRIHVEGLALEFNRSADVATPADAGLAEEWLLSQSHLLIRDSTIHWRDDTRERRELRFDIAKIELRNQGSRHQLEGVVMLPADVGRTIHVAADFLDKGDGIEGWQGSFYLNGLGIQLAPLLEMIQPKGVKGGFGQLDMEFWGRWEGKRLTRLRGEAGVRDLVLRGEKEGVYRLELLNGVIHWQRQAVGWRLDIPRLRVVRDGRSWPDTRLRLVAQGDVKAPHYVVQGSFLNLKDIADLVRFLEPPSSRWREMLAALHPEGTLSDLRLDYHPHAPMAKRFTLSLQLHELVLRAWKKLPAVQGVSGTLWADAESGVFRLQSKRGSVDFPRLARNPWRFDRLRGEVSWQRERGGWYFSGRSLEVNNPDIRAKAELELVVQGAGIPPYLDLRVAFRKGRVNRAPQYYPSAIIPKKLLNWLDHSLLDGKVTKGSLVLHGRLKRGVFPYRNGEGVFEVGFDARDVRLEYLKGWPQVGSLDAHVVFRGNGLRIDARSGEIMGVRIDGSHVRIEDYHDRKLIVLGQAQGDGDRMLHFLRESPIAVEAEPALERMSVAGTAKLGLYLGIPLRKQPVEYRGTVTLRENSFRYRLGGGYLEATNINGRVQFDRDGYRAEGLEAFLFDRPANLTVATTRREAGMTTRIAIEGRLLPAALARQLRLPLLERLEGETALQAELKLTYHRPQPGPLLELKVDSTLEGITSALPPPLQKPDEGAAPLHIAWDDASQRVRFHYSDVLKGDIALGGGDDGALPGGGYLHFGPGEGRRPVGQVLRITGALDGFAPAEWRERLADLPLLPSGKSEKFRGLKVDMELERLHLKPLPQADPDPGEVTIREPLDPRRLPAMTVSIHELKYREIDLGRLALQAHPSAQGLLIEQLVLSTPYMKIQGDVQWLNEREQRTDARLVLTAPQTHTMLEALGLAAMIHGENLHIKGELGWPGSPMDFSLRTLEGDLDLTIGNGRIESMEPGAGRLFGLFSLQALPRRLTLDFRDLFGKGFRFDSIKGEIRLQDGNAITKNLLLEGPTARIAVSGRTGYVARDYDQHILVIPGDGSNLFVAGALAWGPQAGALIWMAEKLLRLDKVAQYVYHVTGSWEKPVITRGREKAVSAPPDVE